MRLNVASAAVRRSGPASPGSRGKSVVTTASIVASRGWIMPAPFAMPPTVNPAPTTELCFGPRSVVRIASAAAPAPVHAESACRIAHCRGARFSSGSGTPMTPVDRTSTSSGRRPSALASLRGCLLRIGRCRARPVAALATPELTTTACGCAFSRCRRETVTGAACTRFVVQTAPPTAAGSERTSARSSPERRIPACTPVATKPLAAVTDISRRALLRAAGPSSRRVRREG